MATKVENFVNYITKVVAVDNKQMISALKKGDNPATAYYAWGYLNRFVDITNERVAEPYALVASSIVKTKSKSNGFNSLGKCISKCGNEARLRRLLSSSTTDDLCKQLRPILSLIESNSISIDYVSLLNDLIRFQYNDEQVKARWAKDFYNHSENGDL
jgi:CRISPR system Cascade subunit CasB